MHEKRDEWTDVTYKISSRFFFFFARDRKFSFVPSREESIKLDCEVIFVQ